MKGETANQKKLRICLGKCQRLSKDLETYKKEKGLEETQISEMKQKQADEYEVRQLEAVLKQTENMIVLVEKDVVAAHEELSQLLSDIEDDEEVKQTEVYQKALQYMKETNV